MKRDYSISGKVEDASMHIIASALMATFTMFYINSTIGAMGGIPAWVGMMVVFYRMRGNKIHGDRIRGNKSYGNKIHGDRIRGNKNHENITPENGSLHNNLRNQLAGYCLGYFLVWAVVKILLLLSKLVGWGSLNGFSPSEYFNSIYGSTLVERWAYVFATVLMMSYVISLFPLVLIRRRKLWAAYLGVDSVIFLGIHYGVVRICEIWMDPWKTKEIRSVMDALFLCVTPHKWQAGMFLVGIFVFAFLVLGVVYQIGKRTYFLSDEKDAAAQNTGELLSEEEKEKRRQLHKKHMILAGAATVLVAAAGGAVLWKTMSSHLESTPQYHKVAECLTGDGSFGPIVYEDRVYIPIDIELDYHESQPALGYIAYKDENVERRIYQLTIANLLYQGMGEVGSNYLEMSGADSNSYKLADRVEEDDKWKQDTVFVLWDEEWVDETAYSKDRTGYSTCEIGLIEQLEEQFGAVSYNPEDFGDYDAYFTINSYKDPKDAFGDEIVCGDWVGCILVKNNEFFYGNYENQIEGEALEALLEVLGGNDSSSEDAKEAVTEEF